MRLLIVICLLFVTLESAQAQQTKAPETAYAAFPWKVEKDQEILINNKTVKSGNAFLQIDVVAQNAYIAGEEIRSTEGLILAPKNTIFVKLFSSSDIFCTASWYKSQDTAATRSSTESISACFEDSDKDGFVDQFIPKGFIGRYQTQSFQKDRILVNGVRLKEVYDIKQYPRETLQIGQTAFRYFGHFAEFGACFGSERTMNRYGCFSVMDQKNDQDGDVIVSELPAEFRVLGARFVAHSKKGSSWLVSQITPVRAQLVIIR